MVNEKIPGWVYYMISGLAGALIISLGVSGTLLTRDRTEIGIALKTMAL